MYISDSLKKHIKTEKASFHMPGHKGGAAFFGTPFENELLSFDVTEVGGTDCLASPKEAIAQSEQKAAKLYGAKSAFYLVNGSTCGILSMFFAFFKEGDSVIVDRSCHISAVNALVLCGLNPVYVSQNIDEKRGVPSGITADKIKKMLEEYPDVKGVFITSPNYYGMMSEVEKIAELAHEKGIVLLVDEAHGAHFPFSNRLPKSAISMGADAAVVSLHKSLPCPNQTALLLINDEKMAEKMQKAINVFQTTSPSYMLLVYIEAALDMAEKQGKELTDRLLKYLKPFSRYQTEDPFKLLLTFSQNGITGYEAEKILKEKFGIYAELCDNKNVLLMTSWGNSFQDFELLAMAINHIKDIKKEPKESKITTEFNEGKPELSPKIALNSECEWILPKDSVGRIAAASVTAFPPCIPVLLPGEKISKKQADEVEYMILQKTAEGIRDGKICVIKE
ncbi:MAG: aminotransferase class I/II-fold pyridoxal phosphate-dependent enzyme [Clostridia bacterium]|nr:aminotransferase class I/II-fold pyridoxal phosphate-dependent enzyme [Clostridia bacterium]